jgi:hydrogenase maturation factor HypF (carbamoyltransferase family)
MADFNMCLDCADEYNDPSIAGFMPSRLLINCEPRIGFGEFSEDNPAM